MYLRKVYPLAPRQTAFPGTHTDEVSTMEDNPRDQNRRAGMVTIQPTFMSYIRFFFHPSIGHPDTLASISPFILLDSKIGERALEQYQRIGTSLSSSTTHRRVGRKHTRKAWSIAENTLLVLCFARKACQFPFAALFLDGVCAWTWRTDVKVRTRQSPPRTWSGSSHTGNRSDLSCLGASKLSLFGMLLSPIGAQCCSTTCAPGFDTGLPSSSVAHERQTDAFVSPLGSIKDISAQVTIMRLIRPAPQRFKALNSLWNPD
eukprot:850683-Amphidinium_carterae.1